MARVSHTVPVQPKRGRESTSNTEGQYKEETQSEPKRDDTPTETTTTTTGTTTNAYENAKGKGPMEVDSTTTNVDEKAKGKGPMEVDDEANQRTKDINEIMYGPSKNPKGIAISKPKKSKRFARKSKPKAPAVKSAKRSKSTSPVKSSYSKRPRKKRAPTSDDDDDANVNETDVLEENQEEPCKGNKKGSYSDDDKDMGGAPAPENVLNWLYGF